MALRGRGAGTALGGVLLGVGSDSQRPFTLVIVGGLFSRLLITVYLMPALYAVMARPGDRLAVQAGQPPVAPRLGH